MQFNKFYEKKKKTECPDSHILYIIMIIIYFYKQAFKAFSVSHSRHDHWVKRSQMAKHKSATFSPQLLFVVSPYFRKAELFKIKYLKVRGWNRKSSKTLDYGIFNVYYNIIHITNVKHLIKKYF